MPSKKSVQVSYVAPGMEKMERKKGKAFLFLPLNIYILVLV